MGSSRFGVRIFLSGAFIQLLCRELVLGVGPFERLPTHQRRQAQPESTDVSEDALEKYSHEFLVSHKFWSPRDPDGIKGSGRWQSGGQDPSIPHIYITTHCSLHSSECGAFHIIWCITFIKNALGILSPLGNVAHQIIMGLGTTQ